MLTKKELKGIDQPFALGSMDRLISSGGDERILLNELNENKYFVNPLQTTNVLNRGSCTCSPLTEPGYQAVRSIYNQLKSNEDSFENIKEEQRNRLLDLYDPDSKSDTQVIFGPSGSDLCYLPILFSNLTRPKREILNIVTCPEELGSGSILAHQAKYFSSQSQFGEPIFKNRNLSDTLRVKYFPLPARNIVGGINDHSISLQRLIHDSVKNYSIIVNLVIGSKSGIEDNISIIEECSNLDVILAIDLCQMRTPKVLIDKLLSLGCMLLITGSKFYQAPPFCSALLVPGKYVDSIQNVKPSNTYGLNKIYSCHDFPVQMDRLAALFSEKKNYSLLLRWEAGLREMELFNALPECDTTATIEKWNIKVISALSSSKYLELMCDQDRTNKSIVSFRVKVGTNYLDYNKLMLLYRKISGCQHEVVPGYEKVLIGQPVSYSNGAFLRLAIGSHDVRTSTKTKLDMSADFALIKALDNNARK